MLKAGKQFRVWEEDGIESPVSEITSANILAFPAVVRGRASGQSSHSEPVLSIWLFQLNPITSI